MTQDISDMKWLSKMADNAKQVYCYVDNFWHFAEYQQYTFGAIMSVRKDIVHFLLLVNDIVMPGYEWKILGLRQLLII